MHSPNDTSTVSPSLPNLLNLTRFPPGTDEVSENLLHLVLKLLATPVHQASRRVDETIHTMRLLKASTRTLHEFFDNNMPKYAILSHRWEKDEVTFQNLKDGPDGKALEMAGWSKVTGCCTQAL